MRSKYKPRFVSILLAVGLTTAACGTQPAGSPDFERTESDPNDAPTIAVVDTAPSDEASALTPVNMSSELVRHNLQTGQTKAVGQHGTADVSAYLEITTDSLSKFPEVVGDPILRWDYTFLRIRDPEQLVAAARIAVRAEVVDFGLPRFNSDTGGYWTPGLHEEEGVVDVANEVWREVQVRVTEVLGDELDTGLEPGDTLVFISRGGQIRVDPGDVAAADGNRRSPQREHPHNVTLTEPFVVQSPPPVDLSKGEDVLLLLDWNKFEGLYGGAYGYRFELMPANEILYKYIIDGDTAVNVGDPEGSLTMPYAVLRELIDKSLGTAAGPQPRPGITPADPHPPVDPSEGSPPNDVDEPDHSHGE